MHGRSELACGGLHPGQDTDTTVDRDGLVEAKASLPG